VASVVNPVRNIARNCKFVNNKPVISAVQFAYVLYWDVQLFLITSLTMHSTSAYVQVTGSNPGRPADECNLGKLLTHVCLCHQSDQTV